MLGTARFKKLLMLEFFVEPLGRSLHRWLFLKFVRRLWRLISLSHQFLGRVYILLISDLRLDHSISSLFPLIEFGLLLSDLSAPHTAGGIAFDKHVIDVDRVFLRVLQTAAPFFKRVNRGLSLWTGFLAACYALVDCYSRQRWCLLAIVFKCIHIPFRCSTCHHCKQDPSHHRTLFDLTQPTSVLLIRSLPRHQHHFDEFESEVVYPECKEVKVWHQQHHEEKAWQLAIHHIAAAIWWITTQWLSVLAARLLEDKAHIDEYQLDWVRGGL